MPYWVRSSFAYVWHVISYSLDIQCCDVTFCGLRRMPPGRENHRASPTKVFSRLLHNYNSQEPPMKGIASVADRRTHDATQTYSYHCAHVLRCSFCVSFSLRRSNCILSSVDRHQGDIMVQRGRPLCIHSIQLFCVLSTSWKVRRRAVTPRQRAVSLCVSYAKLVFYYITL